jgi:hypothetical protein
VPCAVVPIRSHLPRGLRSRPIQHGHHAGSKQMRHRDQDSLAISRITLGCRICGLFRDTLQFRSGLVDLIVGVRHHLCGSHSFAPSSESFVRLVAEEIL